MDFPFVGLLVIVATAVALCAGLTYSIRTLKAGAARASGAEGDGQHATDAAHPAIAPHDRATTELLKRFFDGKDCAICKRPIPPVTRTGLKPGLMNPETHETHSWDEIPNVNLSTALDNKVPLCSPCQVAESFRQRFPDRVVDRARPLSDAPRPDRIGASS